MTDLGSPSSSGLINEFSSMPTTSIGSLAQDQRVQPRQVASGVTRGTWRINNIDGSYITIGLIPDTTDFGIAFFDSSNRIVKKVTATTDFWYNPETSNIVMEAGKLPDKTYNVAIAKEGDSVDDAYS